MVSAVNASALPFRWQHCGFPCYASWMVWPLGQNTRMLITGPQIFCLFLQLLVCHFSWEAWGARRMSCSRRNEKLETLYNYVSYSGKKIAQYFFDKQLRRKGDFLFFWFSANSLIRINASLLSPLILSWRRIQSGVSAKIALKKSWLCLCRCHRVWSWNIFRKYEIHQASPRTFSYRLLVL